MKTLILVRHAKSCWENQLEDFKRPINKRGINDANLVSKALVDYNINPEIILCSSAERTRQTAAIFINNLILNDVKIEFIDALYDFSGESLLHVIKSTNDSFNEIIVFGHNYALTHFVNTYGDKPIVNVKTSGVVKINFEIKSWKDLNQGNTEAIVFPKQLK